MAFVPVMHVEMYVTFLMFYVFSQEEEDEAPHVGNVNGGSKVCMQVDGAQLMEIVSEVLYICLMK